MNTWRHARASSVVFDCIGSRKNNMSSTRLIAFLAVLLVLTCPVGAKADETMFGMLEDTNIFGTLDEPYPLRTADTSSPRDTLRSFIREMKDGLQAWKNSEDRSAYVEPVFRATQTLDLRDLQQYRQRAAMVIKVTLLNEILDRIEMPPYDQIPGTEEVAATGLTRWTIPNSDITIEKIETGPRAGQFLFNRETVRDLKDFYKKARHLPYKRGAFVGLYDEVRYSPGIWLPPTLVDHIPLWATKIVLGQGIWQWIALALTLAAFLLVLRGLYRAGVRWDASVGEGSMAWLRFGIPMALLIAIGLAELVYRFAVFGLGLMELPLEFVSYTVLVIQVGGFAWFTVLISGRIADAIAEHQRASQGSRFAEAALLRILFRLASIFILAYLAIYAAEALGVPIAPLIAGLSVGGLAVALAIRPTLENVVGGLTLFADRPVRVGDFCQYGSKIGTVEEIGLRSTRIRSLERTLVTIPNSTFAHMELDNFSVRDQRLLTTILQLRYETTPEQLRYVLTELRTMLLAHPKVTEAPARVRFVGYGTYSLDLEVFAYLRCQDQDTFLAIQEDIFLRMADIIETAGTSFAYPSQTLYYARDRGTDAERAETAEARIGEMRVRQKLPFPEFEDEERERLQDTLEYPSAGSPHYQPRVRGGEIDAAPPSAQPPTTNEPKTTPLWHRLLDKLKGHQKPTHPHG